MRNEDQDQSPITEEVYQELLEKLESGIKEFEQDGKMDEPFAYAGRKALTPRNILEAVRNRTPEGMRYLTSLKRLMDRQAERNADS